MASVFGTQWIYDSSVWEGQTFYLEAYLKSTDGTTATLELFGNTQGAVPGSTISTSSTTLTKIRSSALTLIDGNTYQVRTTTTGNTSIVGVKLVIIN